MTSLDIFSWVGEFQWKNWNFHSMLPFSKSFVIPFPQSSSPPPPPRDRNLCKESWQLFFVRQIFLCCLFCDTIVFEVDSSSFYKCKVSSRTNFQDWWNGHFCISQCMCILFHSPSILRTSCLSPSTPNCKGT